MTDTTVEKGLDIESIELLDFDIPIPCMHLVNKDTECDAPAEWQVTLNCCGRSLFFCDEHFNLILEAMGKGANFLDPSASGGCGASGITSPFATATRLDKSL